MATFNSKRPGPVVYLPTILDGMVATAWSSVFTRPLAGLCPNRLKAELRTKCARTTYGVKCALILCVWLAVGLSVAQAEGTNAFEAWSAKEFHQTEKEFQSDTNDVTAAWKFASACFDFADFATNAAEHAIIARKGIAACREAIAHNPQCGAAHYYLGQNLGQLARTETLGALKLVRQMEGQLKTAIRLDAHFDHAGPERSLGLLYRDAPGWPMSIGSRRKALQWLKRAEALEPAYPENHLNLLESYLEWHEPAAAKRELDELDAVWQAARTNLVGPYWARTWADWSARREQARERLGESPQQAESSKKDHDSSN